MKKIVCEMCYSTEFVKVNGMFKCKSCGTEYSLDDAKRLLQEIEEKEEKTGEKESVVSFQSSDIDLDFLKFKSEIIMRYNLYQKCHEFNSSMPYKEDNYQDSFPWERKIKFNNQKNELLNKIHEKQEMAREKLSSEKKFVATRNQKIYNLYLNVKRASKTKTPSVNRKFLIPCIIVGLVEVGYSAFAIAMTITNGFAVAMLAGYAYMAVLLVAWFILLKKTIGEYMDSKKDYIEAQETLEENKNLYEEIIKFDSINYATGRETSYVDWYFEKYKDDYAVITFNENYESRNKNIEEYGLRERAKIEDFFTSLEKDIVDGTMKLHSISKKLDENSILPEKYKKEEAITGLLSIIMNKRASSLKETLNIYEEEIYRRSVLNTLQSINYNLGQIHNEFIVINNTLKIGFSTIAQQNAILLDELDAIRITNSAIMVDDLLD